MSLVHSFVLLGQQPCQALRVCDLACIFNVASTALGMLHWISVHQSHIFSVMQDVQEFRPCQCAEAPSKLIEWADALKSAQGEDTLETSLSKR